MPGQYIGGEWNASVKDHGQVEVTFALCFPDTYALGMSHLGLQIIYHVLNARPDIACERCFARRVDMEEELRQRRIPLITLETGTPLGEFDIVGFSLQYEMTYTNVLNMLELAGIPVLACQRQEDDPVIIAGGQGAFAPEPLADFIDLFVVGDGEEEVLRLVDRYKELKGSCSRAELIKALADSSCALYAPAYYDVRLDQEGMVSEIEAMSGMPMPVKAAVVSNLDEAAFPTYPIVPNVEAGHDRITLEIMRGCPHRCRFCQARVIKHPLRTRSVDKLLELAEASYRNTGHSEISLLSLSSSDYPRLNELLEAMTERFSRRRVSISVPSLRIDESLSPIPRLVASVRKSGLTLAPETGGQRLRSVIGKEVSNEHLFEAVKEAYKQGWSLVKLYFMIGLPGEADEDIEAMIELVHQVSHLRREVAGGPGRVNVAVAPFVPKAHTPFQWEPLAGREYLEDVVGRIKRSVRTRSIRVRVHSRERSFLEAVFSRGDRRLGKVLLEARKLGCRLDGWDEHFSFDRWIAAFEQAGVDPNFYVYRPRAEDETFPWDMIATGISKELLWKERAEGLRAQEPG
jgi:radical SAM family uncharacterized protein